MGPSLIMRLYLFRSDAGLDEYPLPDPTRTFFLLPKPDPNYFSKFLSLGFSPASCFRAGFFKSFNNNPQILLSLVVLTWNPLFVNKHVFIAEMDPRKNRKNWQFIYGAFWFIQVYVEAIKSINQKGNNLLSEAHALCNLQLHFTTTRSSIFSGFNLAFWGWPH